jgi:ribosomal protein S18 acetylase RimI-like enzyme
MIELQFECSQVSWKEMHDLLRDADMATYPPPVLEKAFRASHTVVFALDEGKLIGSGRAICDGVCQAAVYDVAILPEYQGRGIGRKIMDAILERVAGCNIVLYATPGKEGFYEKLGFRRLRTGMAIFLNPERLERRGFIV